MSLSLIDTQVSLGGSFELFFLFGIFVGIGLLVRDVSQTQKRNRDRIQKPKDELYIDPSVDVLLDFGQTAK